MRRLFWQRLCSLVVGASMAAIAGCDAPAPQATTPPGPPPPPPVAAPAPKPAPLPPKPAPDPYEIAVGEITKVLARYPAVYSGVRNAASSDKAIEEIGRLTARLRELAAEIGRNQQEELQRRLAQVDERIRWRRERKAPPKCFACGSTEVESVEEAKKNGEGFGHPGCGGVFRISEDPCHIQPAAAFLIPAEGPRASSGLRRLWEWVRRRT